MIRTIAVSVLLLGASAPADENSSFALAAPKGWGGETISLPPGFAPDMKLKGVEHIRFAPGMMRPDSGSFFCYAFAFELASRPKLTKAVVHDEFLSYYRGLCTAVLRGEVPEVDLRPLRPMMRTLRSGIRGRWNGSNRSQQRSLRNCILKFGPGPDRVKVISSPVFRLRKKMLKSGNSCTRFVMATCRSRKPVARHQNEDGRLTSDHSKKVLETSHNRRLSKKCSPYENNPAPDFHCRVLRIRCR